MISQWKDKKVVVMGLGVHGGGLAAAKYFFRNGAYVFITEMKSREQLSVSIEKLEAYCHEQANDSTHPLEYGLSGHEFHHFEGADVVIQNPGVPPDSAYIQYCREHGIALENEASIFFLETPTVKKIAVTGTRGKSTTTALIYDIVERAYPGSFVGGNLATHKGTIGALFDILDAVKEQAEVMENFWVVLELSSWQLELFSAHRLRPDIAVITNVYRDHLNRYGSFEAYVDAKKNICAFQRSTDTVILNADNEITRAIGHMQIPGTLTWFAREAQHITRGVRCSGSDIVFLRDGIEEIVASANDRMLQGDHNLDNILAAVAVAESIRIPHELIAESIRTFRGVPDRLEFIGTFQERSFYNDTAATSPDAAYAALKTLSPKGAIVLLLGGSDKDLDFRSLASEVARSTRAVILFSGTAMSKIMEALTAANYAGQLIIANSMKDAVSKAWSISTEGDIILLSPGAASFGLFLHEFDRGAQFCAEVGKLQASHSTV